MKTIITDKHFEYLGEEIAKNNDMQNPNLSFERFEDSWPNLFLDDVKQTVEHKEVTYI